MITLNEAKNYLRVDFDDDDALITDLITSATAIVANVSRAEDASELETMDNASVAVLYTLAYLYEHREEADHHELMLTLRCLLFGERKAGF
ncbi:MAG: head-tail connector protein [Eubacteriaceae bacterium]|jgi:uncharacterized phage protein (predicted DNA packaging)|nr:head-tail connector protein [Eubacteriaceae bacterium]